MAAPSPSKQNTYLLFFTIATPKAILEACPIDPTVRKSYSHPYPDFFLNSNNSLLKNPVVLTHTSISFTSFNITSKAYSLFNL